MNKDKGKSISVGVEKDDDGNTIIVNSDFFESQAIKEHLRAIEQDSAIKVLRRDNENLTEKNELLELKLKVMQAWAVNPFENAEISSMKAELTSIKVCRKCEHGYWANGHNNKPTKFMCNLHEREETETNTCEKWEIWE